MDIANGIVGVGRGAPRSAVQRYGNRKAPWADMEPAPTMYFPKLQTPRKRHAFGAFLFVIGKLQLFFRLFRKGDHLAVGLLAQVVLDLAGVLGGRLRVNAQREGIAIAKAQGKFKGRKEVKADDFAAQYQRYLNRELNKAQLAKTLEISRPTLDKLIRQHTTA